MSLIGRDIFYIIVTLTERTQLHVSAQNDVCNQARRKKQTNKQTKNKNKNNLKGEVTYSRGCPREKNNYCYIFLLFLFCFVFFFFKNDKLLTLVIL